MIKGKKEYRLLNVIRVIACLAVLLYHFNILKGGYLAVCTFFVLTGYLSCRSAFKKKKFSLKDYYINRFIKIYLPVIMISFMTISVVSFFPNINWLNLKPETTSVLFGYNNFWQINANLDYFARHVNSPFMHLWYIAILLQFDLIFPFIYLLLRKSEKKFNKKIVLILLVILNLVGFIYFYHVSITKSMVFTYYNTFARLFSILLGMLIGFIHAYYKPLIFKVFKEKKMNKIIYLTYLIILCLLFILVSSSTKYFAFMMIITTLISGRLIEYSVLDNNSLSSFDRVIKFFSSISYEIYLFQYPVIFLFQYTSLSTGKTFLMSIIIIIISWLFKFALTSKDSKTKIVKYLMLMIIISLSTYGFCKYITSKDNSIELKKLEEQLSQNQELIQKSQEKYNSLVKQEALDWEETLKDLESGKNKLGEVVEKLPIVGIGDSVMLGASPSLYKQFPNSYIDAKVSRSVWAAKAILKDLDSKGKLSDVILIALGTNGDCSNSCKEELIKACGNRKIFWINTINNEKINTKLKKLTQEYNNLHLIDWYATAKGHKEYFAVDGIHLTSTGRAVYTKLVYDSIYSEYLTEYETKKTEMINKHNSSQKEKISFLGNSILLNVFDNIQNDFSNATFTIDKSFTYTILKEKIQELISNNKLNHRVVLAFDGSTNLSISEYKEIIKLCNDKDIYILSTDKNLQTLEKDNVKIINFYDELKKHDEYLMSDGVHLNDKGNQALAKILKDKLLNK